jgi:hypothetical protein
MTCRARLRNTSKQRRTNSSLSLGGYGYAGVFVETRRANCVGRGFHHKLGGLRRRFELWCGFIFHDEHDELKLATDGGNDERRLVG